MLLKSTMVLGYLAAFSAHAGPSIRLPEVSAGSVAHKSFAGTLCDVPTDILTVPEGQEFLVTMASTTTDSGCSRNGDWLEHHSSMLSIDGAAALAGQHIGKHASVDVARGDGRLPVGSGSTLSIRSIETHGGGCLHNYYVQGYFIEAGSPYRSFYSNSALRRTVFTVDAGKTFLVRTISVASREGPAHCDVYVDGSLTIEGASNTLSDITSSNRLGGFSTGKGALVLTEGQVLEIGPEDPGAEIQCDYYVAGEYLNP